MASSAPAVGIDLGTTFSVVSVYRKRKVEVIQNDAGKRTTPSYVAFTDAEEFVGEAAKDLSDNNTLYDSKRLIGRPYEEVEPYVKNWPFTVINDGGLPKYEIVKNGISTMISPEEISGKILKALKTTAEDSLEAEVTKAVITVPAYFNNEQRTATISAGRLAGLDVIAVINEPTAAAMAFGFGKGKSSTALIFDLGGGTFDVSVLQIEGDKFKNLAHGGDPHLGGRDFDSMLLNFVIDDIKKTLGLDVRRDDPDAMRDLQAACELAKVKLSNVPQATINVFLSRHGKGYKKDITSAYFEELCAPLFKKTIDILPGVLKDAKVSKDMINDVVLVGGSTRIPKVRSLVRDFFDGKELNKSVNPDEAVAQGAAIHAAALTGQAGTRQVVMKDVTALSLGIATSNGLTAVLVPRGTPLPFETTRGFTTASENQEEAEFKVCQGERARWEDNHVLGSVTLSVPSRPQGEVDIATVFSLDANGVLTVTATDKATGEKEALTLHSESRLSERELQDIIRRSQEHRREDDEARDAARRERFRV